MLPSCFVSLLLPGSSPPPRLASQQRAKAAEALSQEMARRTVTADPAPDRRSTKRRQTSVKRQAALQAPDVLRWRPQGKMVGHLHEHRGIINRICVSEDQKFFATTSDDGTVKIWDCHRLEGKAVTNRSRQTYTKQVALPACGGKRVSLRSHCVVMARPKRGEERWPSLASHSFLVHVPTVDWTGWYDYLHGHLRGAGVLLSDCLGCGHH